MNQKMDREERFTTWAEVPGLRRTLGDLTVKSGNRGWASGVGGLAAIDRKGSSPPGFQAEEHTKTGAQCPAWDPKK